MKLLIIPIILGTCILSMISCYNDKEDLLYGTVDNGPCPDTTGVVSYSQKVVPVLQQNCYSCHTGSFPSGGILMGTYTADKVLAQNGKLYGTISHASGFAPMPQGMPRLSHCRIITIKKWIDSGMQNN